MRYLIVFVFSGLLFFRAGAQETSTQSSNEDLKVGLVLSGGGAKGLAHIGALKVIDSLGIKVDYIAGTSMGAIVGSLYASGYTGKQLDSIFKETNFENLISDDIPRAVKTIREREITERYAITLPFKDFKVQLPSSLSKGQNVYNYLSRLLSHVKDTDDFSKLPIPFFCIATDVLTGEELVLDKGYLPRAVNASGALPSVFAPVEIDGRLLTDGGVTDNYPVEKLRAKGMDFIIGVDVQDGLKNREKLTGALDILSQINNFKTINAMKLKKPRTDVYISPDISDFTVVSFDQGEQIIAAGYKAALKEVTALKTLKTHEFVEKPLETILRDKIYISNITVSGNSKYTRAYILGRFKIQTPSSISYEDIRDGVNNLQATNNFDKINYTIKQDTDGNQLLIEVIESDVRNVLHLGLHYDELFKSAALVNLTRKNALFQDDVISADLIFGDNIRYNLDYYLDKGKYWSFGINSDFNRFEKNVGASLVENLRGGVFPGINEIDLKYREWNQRLYFRTRLQNKFNITTGLELKSVNVFTETATTNFPDNRRTVFNKSSTASFYGNLLYDSYDHFIYANTGWRVKADFSFYGWNSELEESFNEFSIAQLQVGRALSVGKLSLRAEGHLGVTIGYPDNATFNFFLGGYGFNRLTNFIPFYGYDFIDIGGDTMIKALFEVDYELFPKNHLSFHVNLASVDDELFERSDWFRNAQYTGYALGYGIDTFLGPLELKYSFSPQRDDSEFFVALGFRF